MNSWLQRLLFLVFEACATAISPTVLQAQRYEAQVYQPGSAEALPEVRCLHQDASGFTWLGTQNGLYRFDGMRFRSHRKADGEGPVIRAIAHRGDTLYAGAEDGRIYFLDHRDGSLMELASQEGYPEVAITCLAFDSAGRFWMGTAGEGLYVRESRRWYQSSEKDGLPSNYINALLPDGKFGMWVGTDLGLSYASIKDRKRLFRHVPHNEIEEDDMVLSLSSDGQGGAVVGYFSRGIASCRRDDAVCRPLVKPEQWSFGAVNTLCTAGSRYWAGTDNGLLLHIDPQDGSVEIVQPQGIELPSSIRLIACLREGSLLSLSLHGQLFGLKPALCAALPRAESPGETTAVLEDSDGVLWFSTIDGLFRYRPGSADSPEKVSVKGMPEDAVVVSLFEDNRRRLWMGTFDHGAFYLDEKRKETQRLAVSDPGEWGSVLGIAEAGGLMWFATLGGVYAWNRQDERAAFLELGIGKNFVYAATPDDRGGIWFCTDGDGAHYLDLSRYPQVPRAEWQNSLIQQLQSLEGTDRQVLAGTTVYQVLRDHRQQLWFHTREQQLLSCEDAGGTGPLNPRKADPDVSGEEVMSIVLDEEGNLVLIHEKSIHWLIQPGQLSRPLNFQDLRDQPRPMTHAICRQGDRIWLGTTDGPYLLQARLSDMAASPKVSLEAVLATGVDVLHRTKRSVRWQHLEFILAAPWIGSTEPVLYEYRLIGREGHPWRSSLDDRITYTRLRPGRYSFEVRARFRDTASPGQSQQVDFAIPVPLYARPWFIGLLSVLVVATIWTYIRRRERLLREREEQERNKIRARYELLRNQVNPHFLFNSFNTLGGLIEEDPEKAQHYVDGLAGFFRHILRYQKEDWISLRDELAILRDYLSIQQERYEDNLRVEIDLPEDWMDGILPPMTLQILVENALKHNVISSLHPMTIRICKGQSNQILVSNPLHARTKPAEGTGIGLNNLRQSFRLLGGKELTFHREEDQFIVEVPLLPRPKNAADASLGD